MSTSAPATITVKATVSLTATVLEWTIEDDGREVTDVAAIGDLLDEAAAKINAYIYIDTGKNIMVNFSDASVAEWDKKGEGELHPVMTTDMTGVIGIDINALQELSEYDIIIYFDGLRQALKDACHRAIKEAGEAAVNGTEVLNMEVKDVAYTTDA